MFHRQNLVTAVLASSLFLIASPLFADINVSTNTTASYLSYSVGNISISNGATLQGAGPQSVVTLDSSNFLTLNSGTTLVYPVGVGSLPAVTVSSGSYFGEIVNSGTIENLVTTSGDAIAVNGNLLIGLNNTSPGSVIFSQSGNGINVGSGGTVKITNLGSISTYSTTLSGILVGIGGSANIINYGAIDANQAGATGSGISVLGQLSGLSNSGSIIATRDAINIASGAIVPGAINNAGTIRSDATIGTHRAMTISATVGGGIQNTGTIANGALANSGAIVLSSTALIPISADINNSGTITVGTGAGGIVVGLNASSNITNTATGILQATANGQGLLYQNQNSALNNLNNAGLIQGAGASSDGVALERNVNGTFTNTGTVNNPLWDAIGLIEEFSLTGSPSGVSGGFTGGLINSGTISGYMGINVYNNYDAASSNPNNPATMNITNLQGGVISSTTPSMMSPLAAININGYLNSIILNNGTIEGLSTGANAISIPSTGSLTGTIINGQTGVIQVIPGSTAIFINQNIAGTGITNNGLINAGPTGNAIQLGNVSTNIVNNSSIIGNVLLGIGSYLTQNTGASIAGNIMANSLGSSVAFNIAGGVYNSGGYIDGVNIVNFNSGTVNWTNTIGASSPSDAIYLNGGILNLSGNVSATTFTNAGGTLSLNQSITDVGNFVQNTGTLQVTINNLNNFGQLVVSGNASLSPNSILTVNVNPNSPYLINSGDYYDVVKVGGTSMTTGLQFLPMNTALISFTQSIAPNGKDIRITANKISFSQFLANNSNLVVSTTVGDMIEALASASTASIVNNATFIQLYNYLASLPSPTTFVSAIQSLVTVMSSSATLLSKSMSSLANTEITSQLNTAASHSEIYSGNFGYSAGSNEMPYRLWTQSFGSKAHQKIRKGVPGYNANTLGGIIGMDTQITDGFLFGAAYSYGYTNAYSKNNLRNNVKAKTFQVSFYGSYRLLSEAYFDAIINTALVKNDIIRNIAAGPFLYKAIANYGGKQFSTRLGFNQPYGTVTQSFFVSYLRAVSNAYTESNADVLSLRVNKQHYSVLDLGTGMHAEHPMKFESGIFIPQFDLSIQYDFIGQIQKTTSNFVAAGPGTIVTRGAPIARTTVDTAIGFDMLLKHNIRFNTRYNLQLAKNFTGQSASLSVYYLF